MNPNACTKGLDHILFVTQEFRDVASQYPSCQQKIPKVLTLAKSAVNLTYECQALLYGHWWLDYGHAGGGGRQGGCFQRMHRRELMKRKATAQAKGGIAEGRFVVKEIRTIRPKPGEATAPSISFEGMTF